MKSLSLPVLGLLLLTPLMIAVGQVLFKMTSERLVDTNAPFHTALFNPIFILALFIYGSATILWIYVLKNVQLSYAYSFMALTFVIVPLLAVWLLGESVNLKYAFGAALIIAGLLLTHAN